MSISIDTLAKKGFTKLPDTPGVYFFLGEERSHPFSVLPSGRRGGNAILYIGKATSLRDRVRSYFLPDILAMRGPKIVRMMELATTVKWQSTDSVLEALLLESYLIKQHQPPYNTDEKDDKSYLYVVITKEKFPRVLLMRGRDLHLSGPLPSDDGGVFRARSEGCSGEVSKSERYTPQPPPTPPQLMRGGAQYKYTFGPFPQGGALKEALKMVRRIFPYRDTCMPTPTSPQPGPRAGEGAKPCFNAQIGLCPGVCAGTMSAREYAKTINHIRLFFEGKKKALVKKLEQEIKESAKQMAFERAHELKKTLFALGHIRDVALLKRDTASGGGSMHRVSGKASTELTDDTRSSSHGFRIEAYDAAHLAGQETVGVMTVVTDGVVDKAEYRKFTLHTENDDIASLREMLSRRLGHAEWRMPDMIVVDGGLPQMKVATELTRAVGLHIPIVAVLKDERHKPKDLLGMAEVVASAREAILLANGEAHRFAIAFHRKTRARKFLER